jgi:hypothetical protein
MVATLQHLLAETGNTVYRLPHGSLAFPGIVRDLLPIPDSRQDGTRLF